MKKPRIINSVNNCRDWLWSNRDINNEILVSSLANPELIIDGKKYISFCSNNYLGLNSREEIKEAGCLAINKFSMGTCESRSMGGNLYVLEELEKMIAKFKNTESAAIFATGLLANVATIPAILDSERFCNLFYGMPIKKKGKVIVVSDELNHRSIQMGIKLSHADLIRYKHLDTKHLEKILADNMKSKILIVTDSVFSMDGDMAPLNKIVNLANKYNAAVMIDEAHATGIFGASGKGLSEHFNVSEKINIHMGTLSKALGGIGGFIASDKKTIDFIKFSASGYRFTSSLPAEQAAGLIKAFEIIESEPKLRSDLWFNIYKIQNELWSLGLNSKPYWSPIIPIYFDNLTVTREVVKILQKNRILTFAIIPPVVAKGNERIRISINSTHTVAHINQLIKGLKNAKTELHLRTYKRDPAIWKNFIESTPDYINRLIWKFHRINVK